VVERDWYRPGLRPIRCADGRELAIDEWRLVADDFSVLRRAGRACWRFLRSDLGSPSPIPLGVIGAIAVWLVSVLRCHYQ
jgi:hypothetical protein